MKHVMLPYWIKQKTLVHPIAATSLHYTVVLLPDLSLYMASLRVMEVMAIPFVPTGDNTSYYINRSQVSSYFVGILSLTSLPNANALTAICSNLEWNLSLYMVDKPASLSKGNMLVTLESCTLRF